MLEIIIFLGLISLTLFCSLCYAFVMTEQERSSTNESPAWMQGALITAVSTSLILFVALIQRYFRRFTPEQVEQDKIQSPSPQQPTQQANQTEIDPQAFTISDHEYNPDYDYRISSPPWSRYTKIVTAIILLILIVVTAQRFQSLIGQIVIAAIFAYLLDPIINMIDRRTRITRNTILIVTYLVLAIFVIWILSALGVTIVRETQSLLSNAPEIQSNITQWVQGIQTTIDESSTIQSVVGEDFDILQTAEEQLSRLVTLITEQGPQALGTFFASTLTIATNTLFIFILSIYIAIEIPKLGDYVGDFAQAPGYRRDAERLTRETSRIWSAYLRGQINLGLAMFFIVWIALGILGVEKCVCIRLVIWSFRICAIDWSVDWYRGCNHRCFFPKRPLSKCDDTLRGREFLSG